MHIFKYLCVRFLAALLLTLLFFTMMYAPGLPLLTPLCSLAFALIFRADKLNVCRYRRKPPVTGDAVFSLLLSLLPLAGMLRLAFACWMFSGGGILSPNSYPTLDANAKSFSYIPYLQTYVTMANELRQTDFGLPSSLLFLQDRVFSANVLPLFALFCAMVALRAGLFLWKRSPFQLFVMLWSAAARERRRRKALQGIKAKRQEQARYPIRPHVTQYIVK